MKFSFLRFFKKLERLSKKSKLFFVNIETYPPNSPAGQSMIGMLFNKSCLNNSLNLFKL